MHSIDAAAFAHPASPPLLDDGCVHLWLLAIDGAPDHRVVAAAARALLGRLLARYANLDQPPLIARTGRGKPYAPALPGIDFNLSHARDHVLIGIARAQPLGVDLERIDRKLDAHDLARRFFAGREADALDALPEAERAMAFLKLWTCKEAVLKALGRRHQLRTRPRRVRSRRRPATRPRSPTSQPRPATATTGVFRCSIQAPASSARVAWHGAPRQIRTFLADPISPGRTPDADSSPPVGFSRFCESARVQRHAKALASAKTLPRRGCRCAAVPPYVEVASHRSRRRACRGGRAQARAACGGRKPAAAASRVRSRLRSS